MIKEEDDYKKLKNLSWKELRDMVEESDGKNIRLEIELKEAKERIEMLEEMVCFVATNYVANMLLSENKKLDDVAEFEKLRESTINEALEYAQRKDKPS